MTEREPFEIDRSFSFDPTLLIEASKRMPLTEQGYVPLGVGGFDFKVQRPTIKKLGVGAVNLSFNKPFGFVDYDGVGVLIESQLTDGIVLAMCADKPNKWQATLNTAEPLTAEDQMLFDRGVRSYAFQAKLKYDDQLEPVQRSLWAKLFRRHSKK